APFAVVAGVAVELCRVGDRRPARAAASVLAALFAGAVGYGVAAGRHFEGGLRLPFALGLGLAAGLLAFALAPRLARALAPRRGSAALLLGAAIAAAVALEI